MTIKDRNESHPHKQKGDKTQDKMPRKISLHSNGTVPTIRIDKATNMGSVYDVVMAVSGCAQSHVAQTFTRLCIQYPEFRAHKGKVEKTRINGSGNITPVAHCITLIEIAYILPGKRAAAFWRSSATMVCRMLGGDLTIIAEVERRHAHMEASSEGAFLSGLPNEHFASKIFARSLLWDDSKFDQLAAIAAEKDLRGSVYLVTSPAINLVKIGSWRGTILELRSRYVTYYGQDLRLWAFESDDCLSAERACQEALAKYRISNELFRPGHESKYLETLSQKCGDCLVCPT
jgi:hypothetical protein